MKVNDKETRSTVVTFDALLQEKLADPEFRRSFEKHRQTLKLGIEIARLRKQAGLSQSELAKRAGMNKQNVSRLEKPNYSQHSLSTLQRIAAALDRDLEIKFVQRKRDQSDRCSASNVLVTDTGPESSA